MTARSASISPITRSSSPVAGDIEVDCDVMHTGEDDLKLVALTTAPGSDAAHELASLVASL